MRVTSVGVVRIATRSPSDVSGLLSFIEAGTIDPRSILAILGKTEGNGGVNDFTREYAVSALCAVLAPYVDLPPHRVEERIAFVMSGGTEVCLVRISPSSRVPTLLVAYPTGLPGNA
jgi:cyanuric acid amidohydrolase